MQDFEKLGVFYLGRRFDPEQQKTKSDLLLFESRKLVTHGFIVGMTGSGKTGLACDLIEEAAIDGIPAMVIDPKGDLSNLLLTFPDLRPEDFAPWVNEDDARRQGVATDQFAAQQAELWRAGLAKWGQDGERIRRLRSAAEMRIYTPGSNAGLPVSMLSSFAAPPAAIVEDPELLEERIGSSVASLLGLIGVVADPVKSRETILLATLLQNAWSQGRDLDLATLIREIQQPPVKTLGVLELESFYPAKDRFELAMQLNNLLASPRFAAWMKGAPLDVDSFFHSPSGRPRVTIFSIAHLGDAERMFFVTLLLNQILAWMRTQSGTTSLRSLLYMDEIFGYFPPVSNPPSKTPLLTLLKQARAYGLGVVLATQNPVDLDYKGLANIGTWCIGRLQTERDKARLLDGLEGAAAGQGTSFDRRSIDSLISRLSGRVFLLHSVHASELELFESRWAMSYLRGPLSRDQIKRLAQSAPSTEGAATEPPAAAPAGTSPAPVMPKAETAPTSSPRPSRTRPVLPPEITQVSVPVRGAVPAGAALIYHPRLLSAAQVRFVDAKNRIDAKQETLFLTEVTEGPVPVEWNNAEELSMTVTDLETTLADGAFASVPAAAAQAKNYEKWSRDFSNWIYGSRKLTVFRSVETGLTSRPGEEEREFRIRLQQVAREERDSVAEKLRQKYAPKLAALNERLRRAQAAREREASQATRAKFDTVISFGSTLLGAFLGRKALSASNIGKAATTMRSVGRSMDQAGDVSRADETVEAVQQQLNALEAEFQAESEGQGKKVEDRATEIEPIELSPTKSNIQVKLIALAWLPFFLSSNGTLDRAD